MMTVFQLCNWPLDIKTETAKKKKKKDMEITKLRTTIWLLRLAAIILPANEIAEPFHWQLTRSVSRQADSRRNGRKGGRGVAHIRKCGVHQIGNANSRVLWISFIWQSRRTDCRNAAQHSSFCIQFQFQFRWSRLRARFQYKYTMYYKAKNKRHNYFLCTAFAVTLNADLWVLS